MSPDPTAGVRLPERKHEAIQPPTADHIEAVLAAIAKTYRLPLIALDQTGQRVSELTSLRWGDLDEQEGRWRVTAANAKTRTARWVPVPERVFQAVCDLVPREDRDLEARVFGDLRREATNSNRKGVPGDRNAAVLAARRSASSRQLVAHGRRPRRPGRRVARSLPREHLRTYAHVVLDRREIDVEKLLADAHSIVRRDAELLA